MTSIAEFEFEVHGKTIPEIKGKMQKQLLQWGIPTSTNIQLRVSPSYLKESPSYLKEYYGDPRIIELVGYVTATCPLSSVKDEL